MVVVVVGVMRVDSQGTGVCDPHMILAKDGQTTNLHDHLRVLHAEVNRNDDKLDITEHRAGLGMSIYVNFTIC